MTFSKNTLTNTLVSLLLVVTSGLIIFWMFPSIPQNVSLDEAEFIRLAQSLEDAPYTPYSPMATGHATLYFYVLLASIKMFGATIFAVRLPSALFGVINVVLLYAIFKIVFANKKINTLYAIGIPFLATLVFATSRWYFNFARFGFEATTVLFFELLGVLSFLLFRQKNKGVYLIISGVFAGLAYNSYTPGRIFFLIPTALLFFEWVLKRESAWRVVRNLLLFLIPFIMLTLPLNLYFTKHDDNRIYEQFYLQSEQLSISQKGSYLWQNITSISGMFFLKGDMNGRHNYPGKAMLNPLIGFLMLVGIAMSLKNWKTFSNRLFMLYFVIGILPPLLTYPWENPNSLRAVTALPAVSYFVGQALFLFTKVPLSKRYVIYGLFFLVGISAIYELRTYFVYQSLVFPASFEIHPNLLQPYLDGKYIFDPEKTHSLTP